MTERRTVHGLLEPRSCRLEANAGEACVELESFAAVACELLAADRAAWAYAAFERSIGDDPPEELCELVLVGDHHVQVAQRLEGDERVLLSVGRWRGQVGLVLSDARAELARRERG